LTVPVPISLFVDECNKDYSDLNLSVEGIYTSKIGNEWCYGSGICIRMEDGPLDRRKPNADQTGLWFTISDGDYSIDCVAHNGSDKYPEGMDNDKLTQVMMTLTESIKDGKYICIEGCYQVIGKDKVFLVRHVTSYDNLSDSQMSKSQFDEFKELCDQNHISPLDLMKLDETLWAELYAPNTLKEAVMLYCLNPQNKQDLLHIGIVTSMGEGKDHLIDHVIAPLVPVGVAGSGKMSTIAGLFGAMSGDDLNAIELGLIPKYNRERIAVSEFQTWDDSVFGELMNVMANGKFDMQKGQLDITRPGCVNMMFLGNPPRHYTGTEAEGGVHKKTDMLESFGQYTYQILSRLTLIFTQMSLTGEDAEGLIEDKIMDSMSGKFKGDGAEQESKKWRRFFREYLRYVSSQNPDYEENREFIQSCFHGYIKSLPEFKEVFLARSSKDMRKFQEFVNLCKAYARLDGSATVLERHIAQATDIFLISLRTLKEDFPLDEMAAGVNPRILKLYDSISNVIEESGSLDIKTIKGMLPKSIYLKDEDLETMVRAGYINVNTDENDESFIMLIKSPTAA
jgi:DNA replicative helicase MCM subunit Mcm2 (Cdc46/Mcm family)